MDRRYWAVLRVILVRPWTKLMAGIWILAMIGVLAPLENLDNFRQPTIAIPNFDQPGRSILSSSDVHRLASAADQGAAEESLSNVHTLDSAALSDTSNKIVDGKLTWASTMTPAAGSWPVLEQLPQLQSLRIQPQHLISADGWERIGQLSRLESLWIANTSPESADTVQVATESASRALRQLHSLRQINVANSSFSVLPPLPNLEYAVLDCSKSFEQNLKTLADHSPKLRELAIQPYRGFQLTRGMEESLLRMPTLRTVWIWSGLKSEADVLTPQLASLRSTLPEISVRRGEYSRLRSNSVFIAIAIMVWPWMIFSVHGFLMQSLPLAANLPGYSRPHLFWPLICLALLVVSATLVCCCFGVAWYAAAAISLNAAFFGMSYGDHWTPWLQRILRGTPWLLAVMAIVVFSVSSVPLLAEEFLAGEYPAFAVVLLVIGAVLIPFRVAASIQRHRIWAEKGVSAIPGMHFSQTSSVAAVPSGGPSWLNGLMGLQDAFTNRRLSRSRSEDFTTKLVAAATGNTGRIVASIVIFLGLVGVHQLVTPIRNEPVTPLYAFALFQGSLMSFMLTATTWIGRRNSLALDLLRPVSREQFWRSVRMGILRDMLPTVLLTVVGIFAMIWAEHQPTLAVWSALFPVILLSALGALLILHSLVVWMISSDRLWLTATLSTAVLVIVAAMVVPTVPLLLTQSAGGQGVATLLSTLLVAGGVIAQLASARSLSQRELGLICR